MKTSKKILSVLLALTLVLALSVCAFAADTYTITINNKASGHTYEAYQIFAGDLSGTAPNYVLSNITWGSGITDAGKTALEDAATAAAGITDAAAAEKFATNVADYLSTSKTSSVQGTDNYTITVSAPGYYLIKDKDASLSTDNADAYTKYIVKVVGPTTVDPKSSVPTVEKKVKENVKSTPDDTNYGTGYNDVADYNIGDTVPFELIGTLPANYADYTTYNYVFHDTASAGLTIDAASVHVYVDGNEITTGFTTVLAGQSLTVTFTDLKVVSAVNASSKIVVKYNATLNSNAEIGLPGNPNEVYLTFSNNPNKGGDGNTGKTPTDKVIVFTYELDTTKVDGSDTAKTLSGAEFKLYKTDGTTPSYAIVADGKVTGWTTDETKATTLTSDSNGLFKVAGLDDGTYYLKETKAPVGYNLLANDVKLKITATTTNGQTWTDGDASSALTALTISVNDGTAANGILADGTVAATITNNSGSTLPSTGGIGTTIFTVAGVVLMIGAAVVLVTKRKVSGEEHK